MNEKIPVQDGTFSPGKVPPQEERCVQRFRQYRFLLRRAPRSVVAHRVLFVDRFCPRILSDRFPDSRVTGCGDVYDYILPRTTLHFERS